MLNSEFWYNSTWNALIAVISAASIYIAANIRLFAGIARHIFRLGPRLDVLDRRAIIDVNIFNNNNQRRLVENINIGRR